MKLSKSLTAKGTVTPTRLAGSEVTLLVQRKEGQQVGQGQGGLRDHQPQGAYSWNTSPPRGVHRIRPSIAKTATHTAATTKWLAFKVK